MQDSVASIIREILYFKQIKLDTPVRHKLLQICMQIFILSSQAQAISHCVFTFLQIFGKRNNHEDETFLFTLIARLGDKVHKKMLQYINNRSVQTVADPVCRLFKYICTNSPNLTYVIDPAIFMR